MDYIYDEYDVVTFDVFDTLVIRNVVKPADVFQIAGGRLFCLFRILAEFLARKLSKKEEITLDDIYKFLPKTLQNKEIETEIAVCTVNKSVQLLYKELQKKGKKLYAVSDMYLPESVIKRILLNCGYEFDGVYVSSKYGVQKRTGNLFKIFLKENEFASKNVIHFGDSNEADILGARKANIKAIKINKQTNRLSYLKNNKELYLKGFVNNKLNENCDRLEQIGYEVLGPIIVSFCQWVHKKQLECGFEKLFFLARDMRIVLNTYKILYGMECIDYLVVSRESLKNSCEDNKGIIEYLRKKEFKGKIAVVDTGWRCTAQPQLESFAKNAFGEVDVGGLYFGAIPSYDFIPRSKNSYTFFFKTMREKCLACIYSSFFEALLGVSEEKVKNYDSNGVPVFFESKKNLANIEIIQKGALCFAEDWLKETRNKSIDKSVVNSLKKMHNSPLLTDIDLIGDSEFDDNVTSCLVDLNECLLRNPREWVKNLGNSAWKGGYFRKSFKKYRLLFYIYLVFDSIYISLKDYKQIQSKKR